MEKKVITPEELKSLQDFQTKRNQIVNDFGVIEFQIQELNSQKQNLVSILNQLKQEESKVTSDLQQKYGDGNIDISNGEFTPLT